LPDATVFSKSITMNLKQPLTREELTDSVKKLVLHIGQPLAYKGVILGHIKVLVKLDEEEFIFFSLTKIDCVDIKFSLEQDAMQLEVFEKLVLEINVLVFGHTKEEIESVVKHALNALTCGLFSDAAVLI